MPRLNTMSVPNAQPPRSFLRGGSPFGARYCAELQVSVIMLGLVAATAGSVTRKSCIRTGKKTVSPSTLTSQSQSAYGRTDTEPLVDLAEQGRVAGEMIARDHSVNRCGGPKSCTARKVARLLGGTCGRHLSAPWRRHPGNSFKDGAEACRLSLTWLGTFRQHRSTCALRLREAESRCARRPGRVEWS